MAKVKAAAAPAKPAAKAEKAEKVAKPSRYIGATSGKRVTEYQNDSIAANAKAKQSDEELAADWREEFPNAKAFDAGTVRTVRNLFNAGKHKNDVPAKPVPEFIDGEAQPLRGEKKAAKAEKAAPAPAAPAKKTVLKKVK